MNNSSGGALRVALLANNAKYVHSSLAVWYLAQAVSRFSRLRHETEVLEATINQRDSDILAKICAAKPDVLGISVYIWNAVKTETLLRELRRELPETRMVLGGPEVSYNAEHWLSIGADFVIRGEGEGSLPPLLDALSAGDETALDSIPGLWRRQGGKSLFTREAEPESRPVDPYSDSYWQALNGRIAYLETSRGCPFQCAFCLSGGSRLRFFPIETAKEQLLRLSQSGARTIKLVDRTFNCNAGRAYELLGYVIGLDTQCCFHFEVAADLFDEPTLKLLAAAPPGRIQLEAGLQSFHQPTLDAVARKTSLESAIRSLEFLLTAGNIHIHVDLIAGLPLETLDIFRQSFNRAYALGAHMLQLGFLKLLHGSALRERAGELGLRYSASPPYEILGSPWLAAEDFETIKLAEDALERVYNSGRFLETAKYALTAGGVEPFELYHRLGAAVSGQGVPLGSYAQQVYDCLCGLEGIDAGELRNRMICDWLSSVGGKNMPEFLRLPGRQLREFRRTAQEQLGRKIQRCEAALLKEGAAFIDSDARDPVTGRYRLYVLS